jgi:putative transposase
VDSGSAIRLAGALLIEQNDEWLVGRRYLSAESLALVLVDENEREPEREEVRALQPA